jgi:hypothetical protein
MENVDTAAKMLFRFYWWRTICLGGELAISTDKLHQRGPIGLEHLVTNKWYIYGNGQTDKDFDDWANDLTRLKSKNRILTQHFADLAFINV